MIIGNEFYHKQGLKIEKLGNVTNSTITALDKLQGNAIITTNSVDDIFGFESGMKISKKTDYALRALVTLTEHYGRGPIPIRELARRNDVPKRFLEHILLELKEQSWVQSVPGRNGGYILGKNPQKITMGQVVRHFDGILAPIKCVSVVDYIKCSQEPMCRFRRIFLEIRNKTAELMDRVTLSDLVEESPVSSKEVFK